MDISDIVSTEYVELSPDTPVSKLGARFEDPSVRGGLVTNAGEFEGVVTRRQLAASHHPPEETVGSETTFGEALNLLREHRFTHLPVVEDGSPVGILSLYDVVGLATREIEQSSGGAVSGFDDHGGEGSRTNYRAHGGFGAREGEVARILDLPVRDVMVYPVRTIGPGRTLDVAVGEMFEAGTSSLVVVSDDGRATGIVTKTDVLRALTWGVEGTRAVGLSGAELLDDLSYNDVAEMMDRLERHHGGVDVLDAKIDLSEHQERRRGTPLLFARVRLDTDCGLFVATGEGYGAENAIREALDTLAKQLRERDTYAESKKHPSEEFWEKRFGWWLEA